ncbi:hypothetical protein [Pseudomonas sichuanensis]|uniref:hypothetical protein n=1 Tax=Pseudomonas sichuanensis TaxID=2213015 RepID=UPI000DA6AF89|nr:hypothetical protein [Pseudomonas sichuanensis]
MLDAIRTFFSLYWHIVVPIVTTLFLAIPIITHWYEVRYWLMRLRIDMPWFGRVAHWVKHPGSREEADEQCPNAVGFYESEAQLCRLYETYYRKHQPSEANFRRCQDYLGKIDEDNRHEKGFSLWLLIIVLMLIEASAFGFALAPFALTLATPNTAIAGAFAIGLVISIVGVFLSEFAGRQLYLNNVVAKILGYENVRASGADGDMVRTHLVTLDNTHIDDGKPHYQQMLNRVKLPKNGDKPAKRFGVVVAYGVFILGLAIAAFWVRTETLNAQEAELIAHPPAVSQAADDFPAGADDSFPVPSDMQGIANEAAGKSAQDQIDALHRASLVTFAVLSGLFIFIQLTSTFLAYRYGFAGTHSRVAWDLVRKFSSAADFVRYHETKAREVATDAQDSLGKLQSLQLSVFRVNGDDREKLRKDNAKRTFSVFIAEQEARRAFLRKKENADSMANESLKVVEAYLVKTLKDLRAAIDAEDNARIQEIIRVARPRIAQMNDPQLQEYRDSFNGLVTMFSVDVSQPAVAVTAAAPVTVTVAPAPAPVAVPAPVVEVAVAPAPVEPVAPAPAPVQPVVAAAPAHAPAAGGFDPHRYGDLTEFHEDDLAYVAQRLGAELDTLKRARRLQMLDKPNSQPA